MTKLFITALCVAGMTVVFGGCDPATIAGGPNPGAEPGPQPVTTPAPSTEICDGFDNDLDGQVDEGCSCTPGTTQACFPGLPGQQAMGRCAPGEQRCEGTGEFGAWGPCSGAVTPMQETCGNNIDEDCDGADLPCPTVTPPGVDAGMPDQGPKPVCGAGQVAPCYGGPANTAGVGQCKAGQKTCDAQGQWGACQGAVLPSKEACGNGVDEDCDGKDANCPVVTIPLFISGDCVTASCPPNAPHPVGCLINFDGGDSRGCVAHTPGSPIVYFQEGDKCGAGKLSGLLHCSQNPGPPLGLLNCPINKKTKYYPANKSGCPAT